MDRTGEAWGASYDDSVLFGPRVEAQKLIEKIRAGNNSESVIHAIGTFTDKSQCKIVDLAGKDKRLKTMFAGNDIEFALPIQRYCWPKLASSPCPVISIAPEGSGKTYAYLLYIVSQLISEIPTKKTDEILTCDSGDRFEPKNENDLDLLTVHPKYIIICSSQKQVEIVYRIVHKLKEKAYGERATESRVQMLQPLVQTINVHHDDHKLSLRCNESEILIGTAGAICRCFQRDFIDFIHCKNVIFDDLDLTLQLHNPIIRDVVKIYILQTCQQDQEQFNMLAPCRLYFFARKWTELVKQFSTQVFRQRILIFGSMSEAAIYANLRFELERYDSDSSRFGKLISLLKLLIGQEDSRIAIICSTNEEAVEVSRSLTNSGIPSQLLDESNTSNQTFVRYKGPRKQVHVISDGSVEFEVECSSSRDPVNNMTHIVHLSMPEDFFTFDTRFRLMYKSIQDAKKALASTIFVGRNFSFKDARQLYDLFSRSTRTHNSTKLELRDLIDYSASPICWRWATTGLCRLEKLSREDRFGSFCPNTHSLVRKSGQTRWPTSGQIKITLTHIVSPNEFYFWIESHRDIDNRKWNSIERSGSKCMREFQKQLDKFKNTPSRSLPLEKISKKKVYGVYFSEQARVDRVFLLDEPKHQTEPHLDNDSALPQVNLDLEYSKQVSAIKLDYGTRIEVFVYNIFELPANLANVEAKCHRGFCLGLKPTNNEPEWPYKATRQLFELVNVINIDHVTAWLRMFNGNCFWLESMSIVRGTNNLDQKVLLATDPLKALCSSKLAEATNEEPLCLGPSVRKRTLSKWHSDELAECASQAFLRRDVELLELYLLDIKEDLDVIVRQTQFNEQLIDLEAEIKKQFSKGQLVEQEFLEPNVYCIARITVSTGAVENLEFNRVKIISTVFTADNMDDPESPCCANEVQYLVECLDHGDQFEVPKKDLYEIPRELLRRLPFQAVHAKLANLNGNLRTDEAARVRIRRAVLGITRTHTCAMKKVFANLDNTGDLYIYVSNEHGKTYDALGFLVDELNDPNATDALAPILIPNETRDEASNETSGIRSSEVHNAMLSILDDIIRQELSPAAA